MAPKTRLATKKIEDAPDNPPSHPAIESVVASPKKPTNAPPPPPPATKSGVARLTTTTNALPPPVSDVVVTTTTNPVASVPGNPPPVVNDLSMVPYEERKVDLEKESEGDESEIEEDEEDDDEEIESSEDGDEVVSQHPKQQPQPTQPRVEETIIPSESTEEDEEESENSGAAQSESGDEMTAMQPLRMYFPPSEYMKKIKLSTRCFYIDFLDTLDSLKPKLTTTEKKWFVEHPQFQHIFHLPKQGNHKVMGMWMLLLRTACIEKRMEVWFVVYGVPIRYGLREHALISGLDCRNYPVDFKRLGGIKFVRKHFGNAVVRVKDVKDKLLKMGSCPDRLQMIVLYFLCSVFIGQTKTGNDATPVVDFFSELSMILTCAVVFLGADSVTIIWSLLAFEAIPELGRSFREPVVGADHNCPRMCKS